MRVSIYPISLFIIGFLVFFITIFSPFAVDDYLQIVQNKSIQKIKNIPSLFLKSVSYAKPQNKIISYYYKPLFYSSYSLLYVLGNGSALVFHVVQLLIYLSSGILVFFIFKKFFGSKIAFLLSLIFLVHPINQEVVTYIASLQDVLFFFFGICGLYLIIKVNNNNILTVILSSLFILLSLLSKESGMLFLVIIFFYILIFQRRLLKSYLAVFVVIGSLYLFFRTIAAQQVMHLLLNAPIQDMSFAQRVIIMPKILYSYFKELVSPSILPPDFVYLQNTDVLQSVFPSLVVITVLFFLVILGFSIRKYHKSIFPMFMFFTIWMLLGFALHSQILPLDVIFAMRWMYFSLVGALGILGVCMVIVRSWPVRHKRILLIALVLYICFFILATERINYIKMNELTKKSQIL